MTNSPTSPMADGRPDEGRPLSISVLVPTRNRPDDLRRCLGSLVGLSYPHWDVLVVDQSTDDRTRTIIPEYEGPLPALRYCHLERTGLCISRNAGIVESAGDVIAFLDDDCTVPPDWLDRLSDAFTRHPHAAVIFGTLQGAPHDPEKVWMPEYIVAVERVLQGRGDYLNPGGYGGSMYVRRSAAQVIGPFDIYLGPGAIFLTNDDRDYSMRALAHGYSVVETPEVTVDHYGSRPYAGGSASKYLREAAFSEGTLHMKLLRCRDPVAITLMGTRLGIFVRCLDLPQLILRRGPTHIGRLSMYLSGLLSSFRLPVDRARRLYGRADEYG